MPLLRSGFFVPHPKPPFMNTPSHSHATTHVPELGVRRLRGDGAVQSDVTQHYGCTLSYVLEGRAEMEIGRAVSARAGNMIVVPIGTPHRGVFLEKMEAWGLSFCPSCLGLAETTWMAPFQAVRRGASPILDIAGERRPAILTMFQGLSDELDQGGSEPNELAQAWLRLLLGEVRKASLSIDTLAPPDSLVAQALTFIETHALEKISLRDVAAAVHCAPSHLATIMKKETGQTVGQWLTATKVSAAASWLIHSDASIDEIADRVGWADRTHFTRQFRSVYGLTPTGWRKQERKHRSAPSRPEI